ncbi:hypothetical protein M472_09400 [Sphingobacterium paucimobilis HER1398]|uniref:Uncharacterized protein n=1 Tax=Sphingobacterium paucimobilis HER1398 TaxID=1346330 RepID=U2J1Z6_9SPHI|nr:hypothetical protein M472_09400 [Sphingobacterium paucimobilis HER1398]
MVWQIRSPTAKNQKALLARAGANAVSDFLTKADTIL